MSDSSEDEISDEEVLGEVPKSAAGEGAKEAVTITIQEKRLTFDEASKCLNTLGKDESGMRYAYLKVTVTDRKLTDVRILTNFRHLLFVDVSGNYLNLQALQTFSGLPFLVQLYAQRNFVECALLKEMPYLQDLSLSRNQITITSGIEQRALEYLDLNFNQIYQMEFDSSLLPHLKLLELRGNYLFEVGGNIPESIEKLYLASNRISRIIESDLSKLRNLKVLHLRNNMLRKLNGFGPQLENLRYLNLRQNRITKVRQFRKLAALPCLDTLILTQNPVSGERAKKKERNSGEGGSEMGGEGDQASDEEDAEDEQEPTDPLRWIRIGILVLLPNLIRINKMIVSYDEREKAKMIYNERLAEIMAEESSEDELDPVTSTTEYLTELDEVEDEEGDM
ncbi:PREDICTED: leucine-rich repeat-containing protein 23-like [Nicrophorus vespilloides]|uniref:Leucine-rich repeat-containing protein 23-like n=1 Tax=Nicrophorus vespilloides TaxID=110193 RepID=A0ABM1MXQ2_NICVS|nr:PREDICTED: leucine-rich repeat-containing protein 23-like [Nicrophorus vespilloides]